MPVPRKAASVALRRRNGREDGGTGCRLRVDCRATDRPHARVDELHYTGSPRRTVLATAAIRCIRHVLGRHSNPWPALVTISTKTPTNCHAHSQPNSRGNQPRERVPASMGRNRQQWQICRGREYLHLVRRFDRRLQTGMVSRFANLQARCSERQQETAYAPGRLRTPEESGAPGNVTGKRAFKAPEALCARAIAAHDDVSRRTQCR